MVAEAQRRDWGLSRNLSAGVIQSGQPEARSASFLWTFASTRDLLCGIHIAGMEAGMNEQYEPKTERGRNLRRRFSAERWHREVEAARRRAEQYCAIHA